MPDKIPVKKDKVVLLLIDGDPDITPLLRKSKIAAEENKVPLLAIGLEKLDGDYDALESERYRKNVELITSLKIPCTEWEGTGSNVSHLLKECDPILLFRGNWRPERFTKSRHAFYRKLRTLPPGQLRVIETQTDHEDGWLGILFLFKSDFRGFPFGLFLIGLVTVLGEILKYVLAEPFYEVSYNISIAYVLCVTYLSIQFGVGPGIFAALLSFFSLNYFFVIPFYRFNLESTPDYVNLFLFIFTTVSAAVLGHVLRSNTEKLKMRERRAKLLYYFNRNLANVQQKTLLIKTIGDNIQDLLEAQSMILVPKDKTGNALEVVYPEGASYPEGEDATALQKTWEAEHAMGWGTKYFSSSNYYWVPMMTIHDKMGLIGCRRIKASQGIHDIDRLLLTVASQAAIALERANMIHITSQALVNEEREKLRSTLLAAVSHDLKTPLASIIGSLSAIVKMRDKIDPNDLIELEINALEESQRLHAFINNILSMSKFESGQIQLKRDWVSVRSLVDIALRSLQAFTFHHTIVLEKGLEDYWVFVDPRLFPQIIQNLIDNAVKYSPRGTTITVGVAVRDNNHLEIFVTDEGRGVPEDQIPRLFDKYARLERKESRVAGTGLGLSIVKILMEAHEGEVEVRNNNQHAPEAPGMRFMLVLAPDFHQPATKAEDE